MIKFTLTRQIGTTFYTLGVLEEPTTGFRCKTLERPVEEMWKNPRKQFIAVPAGLHRMKVVVKEESFAIAFCLNGAWHNAHLVGDASFSRTPAGSVCIGKAYNEERGLIGAEDVGEKFKRLILYLIDTGHLSGKSRPGEVLMEIVQDESFVIVNGKDPHAPKGKKVKPNWDCLEEGSEEDFGIAWEDEL